VNLAENIKRLRRDKGWTQSQLAKHAQVGTNLISKLERGAADPRLSTLYKLMDALGCSADTLLMDDDRISTSALLKAALERALNLPEDKRKIIIDVVDNYVMAEGFREQFSKENNTLIRVWDQPPDKMLKDEPSQAVE